MRAGLGTKRLDDGGGRSLAMFTEHLNSKLRAANIALADPRPQLQTRAAAQINTYVGLLNARLAASDDIATRDSVVDVLMQMQKISSMAKADPQC